MADTSKRIINQSFELSLVIPIFNEELGIASLAEALNDLAPKLPKQTEVILIDDGSTDKSLLKIQETSWKLPVTILELSRNFGHQAALLAGMEAAKGEMVVTLDSDLQHPVGLIPELIALARQGYDLVLTQRIDNPSSVSASKRVTSWFFYHLMNKLSKTNVPVNTSDFRLINRPALDQLLAMPEHTKFLRGLVNWIGYKSVIVPFEVNPRATGVSKYSVKKMLQLAFHGITSFSVMPLYFSIIFSFGLFGLAFLYAMYVLYVRFFGESAIEGWASVLFVLLVLGGFITLFLGLIGSYLAAIFEEVKQRPSYIKKTEYHL